MGKMQVESRGGEELQQQVHGGGALLGGQGVKLLKNVGLFISGG